MLKEFDFLFKLVSAGDIARRYFVTNGFDGALTMLGLIVGFYSSNISSATVILSVCLGATVALTMSGFVSAYISESAERKKELIELEQALVTSMDESAHAKAAKLSPIFIAAVNGLSPLIISLLIISPVWLSLSGLSLPLDPLKLSIIIAFIVLFSLGVFLGKISGHFWLWSGLRTLLVAIATSGIILSVEKLLK
ncbi:MAG: hypothetical protein OEX07_13450 [Gammaproteobacteria bacterium]|nr:hypothetical protein [Gammaproteobacteria bacterium]